MLFGKRHTTYPLLPFSQLVYDMTRFMPSVYTFTQEFVIRGCADKKERIEQALRTALYNHPAFQSAIDCHGRQYKIETPDILHGKYHAIDLMIKDGDLYIKCRFNRILGDSKSLLILVDDICRAYDGKPLEADHYWNYVAKWDKSRQGKHYNDSKAWLESKFADESIPVRPTIDRRFLTTLLPPKPGALTINLTDLRAAITKLTEEHYLSLDGFFSLCAALAIMNYCGTDKAALTWAYDGREKTEEQRIFGSLHRDVPFVIKKTSRDMTCHVHPKTTPKKAGKPELQQPTLQLDREELIWQARNQIRQGIAHSDYPFTLTQPNTKRWNYAVNVIRQTSPNALFNDIPYKVETLPSMPQKTAYALLDVEYYDEKGSLYLICRYSASHYKDENMRRFAKMLKQNAEWLTLDSSKQSQ